MIAANTGRMVKVEILRQDTTSGNGYWQKFEVPYRHGMNVISILMEIQKILLLKMVKKQHQ